MEDYRINVEVNKALEYERSQTYSRAYNVIQSLERGLLLLHSFESVCQIFLHIQQLFLQRCRAIITYKLFMKELYCIQPTVT